MRLLLVRHAETAHNRDGLVQGRADNPLNPTGHAQARALAACLREVEIDAVFSSPLQRALQTAAPIAASHGREIRVDDALAEMDVGELEGLSGEQMRERYPQLLRAWAAGEAGTLRLPGGESLHDVQERAWRFLDALRRDRDGGNILCVTHNFICLAILCRALNLPLGHFRRLRQSVGGLSILDFRPGRIQVVRLNDTCHLRHAGDGG